MTTIIVPFDSYSNGRVIRIENLSKLAVKRNLTITDKDEVGTNVIALDETKGKLLYAATEPGTASCLILDLNKIESCTIKKEYKSIAAGELLKNKLHHFLHHINLKLVFKNRSGSVSLPILDPKKQVTQNVEQLERLATKWQKIVASLLHPKREMTLAGLYPIQIGSRS
ncbi:MAG: hypothetical protein V4717_03265 [Bacteroidota bacterium]